MDSNYYQRLETAKQNFINNTKKTVVIKCDAKTFEDLVNCYFKNDKHTDDYKLPEHAFMISFMVSGHGEFGPRCEKKIKAERDSIINGCWPQFVWPLLEILNFDGIIPEGEYLFSVDK